MPPKVISGGDNPYDIHDAKLSSSATAHESSSVTAHEISNNRSRLSAMPICAESPARMQSAAAHNRKRAAGIIAQCLRMLLLFL